MKGDKGYFGAQQGACVFASSILCLSGGLTTGFNAVLTSQLIQDETYDYDENLSSWIASIIPFSMTLGCFCGGSIIDAWGRRTGQIIIAFPFIAGWFIQAFANNTPVLLIGRFLTGICTGASRPITMIYIGEVTDPKYRAIALFSPSFVINIGVLLSHVIPTFLYWRYGSVICVMPNVIFLAISLFTQESPIWLINKGKIDDGIKSFHKLRGNGKAAEEELQAMLAKQTTKPANVSFKKSLNILVTKPFLKPYLITIVLFMAVQWNGIKVFPYYEKDLVEMTFSADFDTFLLMMILDSIMIFGSVFICFIGRNLPRKISFLTCSFGTALALFILVILLYLNLRQAWISVTVMVLYVAVSIITVSISWSLIGEIFPTDVRGLASGISAATSHFLLFIAVKVTPNIMSTFGIKILYCVFGSAALIFSTVLCFILPETNGITLQNIEEKYNKRDTKNVTRL